MHLLFTCTVHRSHWKGLHILCMYNTHVYMYIPYHIIVNKTSTWTTAWAFYWFLLLVPFIDLEKSVSLFEQWCFSPHLDIFMGNVKMTDHFLSYTSVKFIVLMWKLHVVCNATIIGKFVAYLDCRWSGSLASSVC